jgi:hypothetical protein
VLETIGVEARKQREERAWTRAAEIGTEFYAEKTPKTSYLKPSQRNTTTKMVQSCCKDNVSEFHEEEPHHAQI